MIVFVSLPPSTSLSLSLFFLIALAWPLFWSRHEQAIEGEVEGIGDKMKDVLNCAHDMCESLYSAIKQQQHLFFTF